MIDLWVWVVFAAAIAAGIILVILAVYNKVTAYVMTEMEDFRRGKFPHQFRQRYYLRQVFGTTRTGKLYKTVWGMVFGRVKGTVWELPDLNGFVWGNKELFAYRGITGTTEDDVWIFVHPPLIGGMTAKRYLDELYKAFYMQLKAEFNISQKDIEDFLNRADRRPEEDAQELHNMLEVKTQNLLEKLNPSWLMKTLGIPTVESKDILPRSTRLGFIKIAENLVKFRNDHEDLMSKILAQMPLIMLGIFVIIIVIAIAMFYSSWAQYQQGWAAYFNAVYVKLQQTLLANHIYGFNTTLPSPPNPSITGGTTP